MAAKRLLSIATLYPNAHTPRFGTFVARSLEALAARDDWDVTVINPIGLPPVPFGHYRPLADAARDGKENGVEVHRPVFTLIPRLSGRFNPGNIARAILPLAKELHEAKPFDMVDAQFFYPDGPVAAWVARVLDLPFSVKARGADISYWGAKSYGRSAMCDAAERAESVLAVSEALADDMAELGMNRDKIAIHYTGLDRELFKPNEQIAARAQLTQDYRVPEDGALLSTVGALIERKGQKLVLEALADLPDCRLALVGTGEDKDELQSLADDLGISERVHFLGSVDHKALPVILSASSAMVLPSASEGLANAWVEALACDTPLVISDAGGAKELVRDDSAGRIVERTPAAIASGVRDVLDNPPQRDAVLKSAERFDWQTHAAKLSDIYSEVIAARS